MTTKKTRSQNLFTQAQTLIPGGVNSPVRAFKAVGGSPLFFKKGQGPYLFDEEDTRYIDYVGSWGPMILGHAAPVIIKALQEALTNGTSFGAPTEIETLLAQKVCQLMPNIEMIRMVNSGTEATMTALRLARAYTNRDLILKFEGCYHGHSDSLLVKAGSGALTLGTPSSPGVPKALAALTLNLPYNDIEAVNTLFASHGEQIAAVIVEPIAGNMGCVLPIPGFLENLRIQCDHYQSVLIFDEVMTGFRVALGGAQELYNIKPDLTTLGKIIGGGLPVGALGGLTKIMSLLAPLGPVYQAGTLSGNPLAMHAGLANLNAIDKTGFHENLKNKTKLLTDGLQKLAIKYQIPVQIINTTGMFSIFFTEQKTVNNLSQVLKCDSEKFIKFFQSMLAKGFYFAPSPFEAGFISYAHEQLQIQETLNASELVFATL
jgi:glutamate-1-semialdehyde 2,1-aminomutase